MEKLLSLVPEDLRRAISGSATDDLDYTCQSLLDFLSPLPQFQQIVRELGDPEMGLCKKSREAALDLKKKGNDCFVGGDFAKALSFYSQALRVAPVVLKNCRETHCHFCLNELPPDVLFCSSCTTPLYCSEQCQEKATGGGTIEGIPEHRHECGGVNWPAVLPSDVVLVGRVMAKLIERRCSTKSDGPMDILEFVHHYSQMPPESKLESHIFSVVLASCLNYYFGSDFPFTGASAAVLVIVLSQMKVNAMAVVHMKSSAINVLTCNTQQIRVGQAVYLTGRLFNHSCQPNIHAYFLSRKLLLRSTEFVPAGFPLEISYGPQVGQWGSHDRQKLLEDQYFFKCKCSGCSELNLSDLVIYGFRCLKPTCLGAVLENCLELPLPVFLQKRDAIDEVAHLLLERSVAMDQICPGHCLNCYSECDLKSSIQLARTAFVHIGRLKNAMMLKNSPAVTLPDALQSLEQLRSVRHAYSKDVAQAEDIIAEASCLAGDFKSALKHCKASINILEKLFHDKHIVIGNELVKLASLQLSLGDRVAALYIIDRVEVIFSLYYGPHAAQVIPYLGSLRKGADLHIS